MRTFLRLSDADRIPKHLIFLDLATDLKENKIINCPELKTNNIPAIAGNLDLALSCNTILVPNGLTTLFNKMMLKHQGACGEFVLFPNLPEKLKSHIFEYCSDSEPRKIKFMEMPDENDTHSFQRFGATRPAIFAASKPALLDAIARKRYVPMFAMVGSTSKLYYCARIDWAELGNYNLTSPPTLNLAEALVEKRDLKSIQVLHMSWYDLFFGFTWAASNLASFPNLQTMHVTSTEPDPGRANRAVCILSFRDAYVDRNAFMQFCSAPDGRLVRLGEAMEVFGSYICDPLQRANLFFFHRHMNHCLEAIATFPREVVFILQYVPVPGYPLAAVQPVIQNP